MAIRNIYKLGQDGSSAHLGDERKTLFVRAKVIDIERSVGGKHPDKCNIGKVKSFCHHLSSEQYVRSAVSEFIQNSLVSALF